MLPEFFGLIQCIIIGCVIVFKQSQQVEGSYGTQNGFAPCCCTYKRSNKNLAIANRSRVSCAHSMSRASMITPWPWNLR